MPSAEIVQPFFCAKQNNNQRSAPKLNIIHTGVLSFPYKALDKNWPDCLVLKY